MSVSRENETTERDGRKPVQAAALSDDRNQENSASTCFPRATKRPVGVKVALIALRIYKAYFSILFAGNCRFEPTCSLYMYEAIERFGVRRGSWMGCKRLLRCQPLSRKFGYDPVPEKTELPTSKSDGNELGADGVGVSAREAHS